MALLDEDGFLQAFQSSFSELPSIEAVALDTGLWEDLDFDSIEAVRLLIWIDDVAGLLVPLERTPEMYTLADAYAHYQVVAQAAADEQARLTR